MGKRGPKPADNQKFAKKGATLGARITAKTRATLDKAAQANGRSLSAEVEARLADSFAAENEPESLLLAMLRECMRRSAAFTGKDWIADPFTFDMMSSAITTFLRAF